LFYLIIQNLIILIMKKEIKNWVEENKDYWVNKISNYVVRDNSTNDRKEWVILDNREMMLSCEWRDNKEDCIHEADSIYSDEIKMSVA